MARMGVSNDRAASNFQKYMWWKEAQMTAYMPRVSELDTLKRYSNEIKDGIAIQKKAVLPTKVSETLAQVHRVSDAHVIRRRILANIVQVKRAYTWNYCQAYANGLYHSLGAPSVEAYKFATVAILETMLNRCNAMGSIYMMCNDVLHGTFVQLQSAIWFQTADDCVLMSLLTVLDAVLYTHVEGGEEEVVTTQSAPTDPTTTVVRPTPQRMHVESEVVTMQSAPTDTIATAVPRTPQRTHAEAKESDPRPDTPGTPRHSPPPPPSHLTPLWARSKERLYVNPLSKYKWYGMRLKRIVKYGELLHKALVNPVRRSGATSVPPWMRMGPVGPRVSRPIDDVPG